MKIIFFSQLLAYLKPYLFEDNPDKFLKLANKTNELTPVEEGIKKATKEESNQIKKAITFYNSKVDNKIVFEPIEKP